MSRSLAAVVAAALLLAGCGPEMKPTSSPSGGGKCPTSADRPMALAIGAHANVPTPEVPGDLSALMTDVAQARQQVTIIRVDGDPKIIFDDAPPPARKNERADDLDLDKYVKGMNAAFRDKVKPVAAEVDLLRALTIAGKATAPGGTIALIDSGLQTVAPLHFGKDDLLAAEPADVAKHLADQKLLPDLAGRTVALVGFGNTAAPQPVLDNRWSGNVVAIWKAIVEAAQACVYEQSQSSTKDAAVSQPAVSVVTPPAPAPLRAIGCGQIELGSADNISFQPDSREFKDRPAATERLRELAGVITSKRQRAELIGRTATYGPPEGRITLSQQRAEAVRDVLVELGVPADRVTARGVGTDWPEHVQDVGPDGGLLPGPAEQNRKVVVKLTCEG